jgi:hypothetical protein
MIYLYKLGQSVRGFSLQTSESNRRVLVSTPGAWEQHQSLFQSL